MANPSNLLKRNYAYYWRRSLLVADAPITLVLSLPTKVPTVARRRCALMTVKSEDVRMSLYARLRTEGIEPKRRQAIFRAEMTEYRNALDHEALRWEATSDPIDVCSTQSGLHIFRALWGHIAEYGLPAGGAIDERPGPRGPGRPAVKHTGLFKTFLSDVVDLNATRLDQLEASVDAIKSFIRSSDWKPGIEGFISQGSWAHKTIIKPIAGGAFDADIIVRVAPVEGWEAKNHINSLMRIFSASSTYTDELLALRDHHLGAIAEQLFDQASACEAPR